MSSVTKQRPDFEGQLNLRDIKPGARITVHSAQGDRDTNLRILEPPHLDDGKLFVRALDLHSGYDGSRSLADMGVVPYEHGPWNGSLYATFTAPVEVEASTLPEFFDSLKAVAEEAAPSMYLSAGVEAEVVVRVPEALQSKLPAQELVYNDKHGLKYGSARVVLVHA